MRTNLLFSFLVTITFFQAGYAQLNYKWHAAIKSPYSEFCYAAGVDSVGNSFYLLHLSDIVVDVDPGPGQFLITRTNTAFALIKLDTNGVLQFARKIECTVSSGELRFWTLKPDRYGNINIIGDYNETVDFDPGPGIYAPPSVSGGNTFLARYDQFGNFIFMKPFTGSNGNNPIVPAYLDEEGRGCLAMISKGNIFYDGVQLNGNPPLNWYSIFVWLDNSGNVIQHFFLDATSSVNIHLTPENIMLDSTMSIVVTGNTFMGSVDFDPGPGSVLSAPTSNFVAKYSLNGALKFVRFYEDSVRISCLARLSDDRILIALGLNATVDMDPGPGVELFTPYPNTQLPFLGHDVLFSLLDSSGIFIYAKKFGGYSSEHPRRILVDEFDNFYIAGHFTDSILTDPSISMQGINSVGNHDAFVAYFDQNGKNQFILPLESMGADYYINNLLLDKNYHLIISGGFDGYTDFDLGITVAQDSSSGFSDFYTSRYRIERIPQTGFDYHKYSGIIYRDYNANGIQDPGDPALRNRLVNRTPGSKYSISDQSGYYAGYGVNVNYLLTPLIPFPSLISSNPGSHQAALSSVNPIDNDNHFGWYPNSVYNDLAVEITSPGGLGYFLPRALFITCINRSIDSANAAMRFVFDPAFSVVTVLPAADSANAGNYYWNLGKLAPFEEKTVNIQLLNTTLLPGDFSTLNAFAYPVIGDITPSDNSDTLQVSVFGAYDPNMKSVEPNGSITPSQVAAGQWLDYTIQFQNVGNDTAHRVIIADTLSTLLDLATLDIIGASHPYNLLLDANRLLVVRIDNIQLPDSATNPAGSCGFFRFRIKPITSISLGDSILNSASIFFDVNPSIVTNETVVKIELLISLGESAENPAKIYPNVTSSWIYLDNTSSAMKGDLDIRLTDMMGRIVLQKIIRSTGSKIPLVDMRIFPNGVYIARVSSAVKTAESRIVKTW